MRAAALARRWLGLGVAAIWIAWPHAKAQAQTVVSGNCYSDDFMAVVGADQVFDLTISLYAHPTAAERSQYEEVFRHFARGVFEMSNGRHKIRKLVIHQDGFQKRFANVIWARGDAATQLSAVTHMGGIVDPLGKIYMYDVQQDANSAGFPFLDLVRGTAVQRKLSGYILAHEFGHYAYSMGDEYRRGESDNAKQLVSVMSVVQATVQPGKPDNLQWLNFSTASSLNGSPSSVASQGSIWGLPSWGLLHTGCANRPRNQKATGVFIQDDGTQQLITHFPKSVYYGRLDQPDVIPGAGDTWVNPNDGKTYPTMRAELMDSLDQPGPLDHLDVVWMDSSSIELELVLDASGSMSGQPIKNVIAAAKAFVGQVPFGRTTVGVTTFESTVDTTVLPLTPIGQAADVQNAQARIDTIKVGDDTALFRAANDALAKLSAFRSAHGTKARQVVFLLSDGHDNASGGVTEDDVSRAYRAAGVPMYTVGFADRAASQDFFPPLERLAAATGGTFFKQLTQTAELNEAMRVAIGDSLSVQDIKLSGLGTPFPVDVLYAQLVFDVAYRLAPGGDVRFDVVDGAGRAVPASMSVLDRGDGSLVATIIVDAPAIANAGVGNWRMIPTFLGAGGQVLSQRLAAVPGATAPVELGVSSRRPFYLYPDPIDVFARAIVDGDVTGLDVTAELTMPDGSRRTVIMNDDGAGNDVAAKDGLYSGRVGDYDQNGLFTLTVSAANRGDAVLIRPAGEPGVSGVPTDVRYVPLTEAFSRQQKVSFVVLGVTADDHGNAPDAATIIQPDGVSHPGKIETAGDVDFFRVQNVDVTRPLTIRLYDSAFGFAPQITVFAADGVTPIASGNAFVSSTDAGTVAINVPTGQLASELFFVVSDLNGRAGGTYTVDASPTGAADALAPSPLFVESRESHASESNVSGVEIRIENRGTRPVADFKIVYYFDTEFFQQPVLEDWWSGISTPKLVQRGTEQYAIEFDYTGFTLAPGGRLPFDLENSVGLHYADWSRWDRRNDASYNGQTTFTENRRIAVFDRAGRLIYGQAPFVRATRAPVVDVVAWSREDKLADPAWTSPDIYLENRGDDLTGLTVVYTFLADSPRAPVLADFDSPTASVTLEHVSGAKYRIKLDYRGFTLRHDTRTPYPSRALVGIHDPSWTPVNRANDPSFNAAASYAVNPMIQVFDDQGRLIFGPAAP